MILEGVKNRIWNWKIMFAIRVIKKVMEPHNELDIDSVMDVENTISYLRERKR